MKTAGPSMPWDEKDDAVSARAADFFTRRRFGGWSDADQAGLDAWLAESVLHEAAYLRVEGIAANTEELFALRSAKPVQSAPAAKGKFKYRYFAFPLLAAASIALFGAFGIPLVDSLLDPPVRSLSTDVGGRTLLRFLDGTEFELNTDTSIRYRMTNHKRVVWLDRGEVWFHVAHNPANPFAVMVGKHRVTDLGTEFFVRRGSNRIEVALLKGGAALSTEGVQTITLRPGDDAIATSASMSITRKTQQELSDELAWRRGILVFRNARLADVVREFNRYNTTKLVIADPGIAGVKITADLRPDDFDGFVQLTKELLSLRADREGNEILFSRELREKTKRGIRASAQAAKR